VLKDVLTNLDSECRKFLGHITNVPNQAIKSFFYADRRIDGPGTCSLSDDADVWTIARAVQPLSSKDDVVRGISWCPLRDIIRRRFRDNENPLPIGKYPYGSNEEGLQNAVGLWRLPPLVPCADDVADDVSSVRPVKTVRGLRKAIRQRHTRDFLSAPHQGKVAEALDLDSSSKDMSKLISCHTQLLHSDWKYLHRSRLDLLGVEWVTSRVDIVTGKMRMVFMS